MNETIHKIESRGQYWNDYMYYEEIIQWSTHLKLKLEHLDGVLKQFIKTTEFALEGKLYHSTISKAQL